MSWILIRHGRTEGNDRHAYTGLTDEPLSAKGKRTIWDAVAAGFYPSVEKVYISPMRRCMETAAIIYPELVPERIWDFREMDFGRFEGKTFEELKDDKPYMDWVNANGRTPFPAGEGEAVYQKRVRTAFRALWDAGRFKNVALVVHGGTIMAIMSAFFPKEGDDGFAYQLGNGDYYVVPEAVRRRIADAF